MNAVLAADSGPVQPTRETRLAQLRADGRVNVLVIGAGINGAGVFRELALHGLDVLLVDRADFCGGTSAASGRVIHGGIRYLENGEFRLVRESLLERNRLLKNAPHCVKPLPATIPIFGWLDGAGHAAKQFLRLKSRPGNRGALVLKAGLVLYDLLARENNMLPRHAMLGRRRALAQRPGLNPAIVGTATYYDAQLDYAERLCLEVIMDAEQAHPGAAALNYVALHSAHGGTVTLRDECTGTLFDVRPQVVINATGAWIDFANRALGRDTALIGGTKGSHIVVNHPELHALCQGQMFHFVTPDGRLAIFYPLGDRVLIGTTDLPIADPDDAVCDEDETAYLLGLASRVFPEVRVTHDQIVFHFSGVRPLPRSTALVTGQISRDHSFPLAPPTPDIHFPVYSLVGGKWTTFRAFSEQVADAVLATLDRQRQAFTTHMAIGGGRDFPSDDAAREAWVSASAGETGLPADRVRALFSRYGTYAARVAAFMAAGADQTVPHASGYSARELQFLALHEHVVHLDDLILRRTMIGMLGQLSTPLLEALARLTAEALGWDDVRTADETNRARALLWSRHGVRV